MIMTKYNPIEQVKGNNQGEKKISHVKYKIEIKYGDYNRPQKNYIVSQQLYENISLITTNT